MANRDIPPLSSIQPIRWEDGKLIVIDQRKLPLEYVEVELTTLEEVAVAIEELVVRGAPLIGIAAAYGLVLAARENPDPEYTRAAGQRLLETRPTAFSLQHTVWVMPVGSSAENIEAEMLSRARELHEQDLQASAAISECARDVFMERGWVLTICNTGALATGGGGTALGLIVDGYRHGLVDGVYVCETRPVLQGARLTCWELDRLGVPFKLLADSAAASLLDSARVTTVVVGADRISRYGDVANKIGTLMLAELAGKHDIPFYVAAPLDTVDLQSDTSMPIEHRGKEELQYVGGTRVLPDHYEVYNPAFDEIPAHLVTALVTERGIIDPSKLEDIDLWI